MGGGQESGSDVLVVSRRGSEHASKSVQAASFQIFVSFEISFCWSTKADLGFRRDATCTPGRM